MQLVVYSSMMGSLALWSYNAMHRYQHKHVVALEKGRGMRASHQSKSSKSSCGSAAVVLPKEPI